MLAVYVSCDVLIKVDKACDMKKNVEIDLLRINS